MSLILVIEQDGAYTERIRGALTAEGWTVRVVGDRDSALAAARQTTPDLVVVSTATPGAGDLLRSFGRDQGGPGVFALVAAGEATPEGADGSVAKPFTDEQLRAGLRRCLSRVQRAAAEAAAAQAASAGEQLTSQDLFGDLLAEVEAEVTRSGARTVPAKSAMRPPADDMARKLEETLSGVMRLPGARGPAAVPPAAPTAPPEVPTLAATPAAAPATPAPPPSVPPPAAGLEPAAAAPPAAASSPPAAARAAAPVPRSAPPARSRADTAVDDLLTQTLSGLGVTRPRPKAAPASQAAAPPPAAAAPAVGSPPRGVAPEVAAEAPPQAPPEPPRQEPPASEPPRREPEPEPPARREPPPGKPEKKADKRARREGSDVFAPPPPLPTPAPPAASPLATQRVEAAREEPPRDVAFGQYTLLERVAVGGMAEVWKARMKGVEGFQKTVAIKKILAHLTDSVDFVTMFIDEAKLAAQLNHPHIIHIYDLGKIDEDFYIAMEYVEGKDLRSILNTARREGTPLPVGLALLVASRLASALDYAHRKRDFDNRELGLVHRDISPQNVLISYEGDIKLCDFGIAKAVAKASKTQMGALKGKLQYMSPEQAWGRVVDSRSDIFSLGAVLFEMLTGRRLFAGESEISVLESVRECRVQSVRDVDPTVPEPVDAIVRRALAEDPDDRYQTAGEMQKEIDAVLHSLRSGAGQSDLAAFMHRLHGGEAAALSAAGAVAAATVGAPGEREVPAVVPIGEPAEPEARRRPWLIPAAAAAAALLALLGFLLTRGPSSEPEAGRDGAPPAAGPAEAAPATVPRALPAGAASEPPPAAVPAGAPATAELEQRVQDQLRAKQQQLEQQLEEQRRQLAAEVQRETASAPQEAPAKAAPTVAQAEPEPAPAAAPPPAPPVETPALVEERPEPPPAPRPAPSIQQEPARPVVREGDLVTAGTPGLSPPGFVSFDKPEYPPLAKRMRVEGTVVVGVLVDESGQVRETRLVKGVSQNVGLNEAALRAARTARYRPAIMAGVRVKTWVNLTIPFKL